MSSPEHTPAQKQRKLLHHIAVGGGFLGLILWFYVGREIGVLDWATALMPEQHAGAGLMLGIMLVMTPGFFIWARYNRWVEQKLAVRGFYYETAYDAEQAELLAKKKAEKSAERHE
ncbi:hypothetical protein [Neptuniibacter sp. CAU 1671]|uniref:hypothetical protein n=1 Tax=Neptuniibacter sp. CAU 1671 TaxID=3032593 RepID=UPI0023DCE2B1|nr:hypothetical protein [Neptuniibacter sp. CAU 1671]MDF2180813.1 hypothetical protein [Neptuniibacter sp. CAU 1671]